MLGVVLGGDCVVRDGGKILRVCNCEGDGTSSDGKFDDNVNLSAPFDDGRGKGKAVASFNNMSGFPTALHDFFRTWFSSSQSSCLAELCFPPLFLGLCDLS